MGDAQLFTENCQYADSFLTRKRRMMAPSASHRQLDWHFALVLCLVVSLLRLLWPGDTQWIDDEPLFLTKAAAINAG
jgi:hypothetical protein